ncbi:hypothetical protein BC835DRAFT_1322988 [Cytidiella melzeri]|nr:hypothetical protein BC835DRAFT_1322988 [Cytidiella melzeri]
MRSLTSLVLLAAVVAGTVHMATVFATPLGSRELDKSFDPGDLHSWESRSEIPGTSKIVDQPVAPVVEKPKSEDPKAKRYRAIHLRILKFQMSQEEEEYKALHNEGNGYDQRRYQLWAELKKPGILPERHKYCSSEFSRLTKLSQETSSKRIQILAEMTALRKAIRKLE